MAFGTCFLPCLVWLGLYRRWRPQGSLGLGALFLGAGVLAGPVSLALFELIETSPFYAQLVTLDVGDAERFAYAIFAIGPIEEMAKFMAALAIIRLGHVDLSRVSAAALWATAVGIGFAAVENWYYMIEIQDVVWHRAITLPFNHALFSSFWGVGLHLRVVRPNGTRWMVAGLVLSFVYHGLYDYILLSPDLPPYLVLVLVASLYVWVRQVITRDNREL